jgi:histidyl-tRNA synthetase
MLNNILSSVGLRNYRLKINSVGCPKCRAEYRKALKEYFGKYLGEMCEDCQSRYEKNPMRLLDCKVQKDKEYAREAPSILDYLCEECRDHFANVKKYLDLSHVIYEVDSRIVRGLDYYTKTAFEFEHLDLGAQAVIAGGGRYDGLVEEIGGPSTPSVGFGMGVERVILAMKAEKVQFLCENDVDVYIVHSGKGTEEQALELTSKLRSDGIKAYISVVKRNMSGQFKHANKIGARLSIVIGEDELTNNFYTVKNMVTGDQSQVEKEWVTDIIKEKLEGI